MSHFKMVHAESCLFGTMPVNVYVLVCSIGVAKLKCVVYLPWPHDELSLVDSNRTSRVLRSVFTH